jgi:hypothetical protein
MIKQSEPLRFPTGDFTNGEFTITFTSDQRYFFKHKDTILVEGSYIISDDKIILTDKSGTVACTEPATAVGRYGWKYDNERVIFSKIEDNCEGRISNLTKRPIIRLE